MAGGERLERGISVQARKEDGRSGRKEVMSDASLLHIQAALSEQLAELQIGG